MATDYKTITFFAFPREIRDLIYTFLTPKEKTYTITSANAVAIAKAFSVSEPDLGIINTCKAIQHEMSEILSPNNTFRFPFPRSDISPQITNPKLAALMLHVEFDIEFGNLHGERFRADSPKSEVHSISEQASELLRIWNRQSIKRESCRRIIRCNRDNTQSIDYLSLPFFQAVQTLVGLDTLLIEVMAYHPNVWRLETLLSPSLGRAAFRYEFPFKVTNEAYEGWGSGFLKYRPRKSLAERRE